MKKVFLMIVLVGFVGAFASESYAQQTRHGKKRMERQKNRTKRGVKSGSLTKKETAKIARQRRNIKKSTRSAKSDGKVTLKERRKLRGQLNRSSKTIYKSKHNKKTRRQP